MLTANMAAMSEYFAQLGTGDYYDSGIEGQVVGAGAGGTACVLQLQTGRAAIIDAIGNRTTVGAPANTQTTLAINAMGVPGYSTWIGDLCPGGLEWDHLTKLYRYVPPASYIFFQILNLGGVAITTEYRLRARLVNPIAGPLP
jgi:hypothetical protein